MKKSDFYEILGVDKSATPEQIKKARRKKAAAAHPDAGGDHDQMAAINHAYDVLSDPQRRQRYDETGQDQKTTSLAEEARHLILTSFQIGLEKEVPFILIFAKEKIQDFHEEAKAKQKELDQGIASVQHGQQVCQLALEVLANYSSEEKAPDRPSLNAIDELMRQQAARMARELRFSPFRY